MTSSPYSRLLRITAGELKRLDVPQLAKLDWLLREAKYDRIDVLCSRADVAEVGSCLRASDSSGCLYWLQNLTKTIDDHALAKGTPATAPFPRKSYFLWLMGELLRPVVHPSPECQRLYIPKSRECMTSWLVCGYVAWLCQWRPGVFAIMQTAKETKAVELIRYVRILWEQQEPFLQERHPLAFNNLTEIGWRNGSRVMAVPAGEDQVRAHHPFLYVLDEAAMVPEGEECMGAVLPVAKQIVAVSTARPGWFEFACTP